MKRTFFTILLIAFPLFILSSFSPVCHADGWQWISSNSNFTIWIKPSSIRINRDSDDQSKVYGGSAWVKLTYDPSAAAKLPVNGAVVDGLYAMMYIYCDFPNDLMEEQEYVFYNSAGNMMKKISKPFYSKFYISPYSEAYYYILNTATGLDIKKTTNGNDLWGGFIFYDKNGKKWVDSVYVPSVHYDNENHIIFALSMGGYSPDNTRFDKTYRQFFSYQPQDNTIARKGFYAMDLKAVQYGQYEAIVPDSILEHIVNWVKPYCEHTDSNWLNRNKNGFIRDTKYSAPPQTPTSSNLTSNSKSNSKSTSSQLFSLLPYDKSAMKTSK